MDNTQIMELGKKYLMNTYSRFPIAIVKGEGCRVWDADGKEYIDCVSGIGVTSLGHSNPEIAGAICRQSDAILHCSNLYWIKPQAEAAKLLVENSDLDKVFFANSGAEANEGAIKLARKYSKQRYGSGRYEIITMKQSFHGRTMATLTATGQDKIQKGYEPLLDGFKYVPYNDYAAIKDAVSDKTCAIMLEVIQGEGGVHPADSEYLNKVEQLCKDKDLVLIIDEVQSGMGRTGRLFAYQHHDLKPGIITLAKALANGTAIGAVLATDEVAKSFQPGDHATTFGGNFIASIAAKTVLELMLRDKIPEQAGVSGSYFMEQLDKLKPECPEIVDVRGMGLLIGVELSTQALPLVQKAIEKGLLLCAAGPNVARFLPPLNIDRETIDTVVGIFKEAILEGRNESGK